MKVVINDRDSAAFNLACEEYLATHYNEPFFMIWSSKPTILIGKNQNAYSEINMEYVTREHIPVIRRESGGGSVFCDPGNMNFTFIQRFDGHFANFKKFTEPVLNYLIELKVPASFSGRNDLVIEGKKFSGNAQYKVKDIMVHHGTLLYSSSLHSLSAALTPKPEKFSGKGIDSVRARVTNISEYLADSNSMSVSDFKKGLYAYIISHFKESQYYHLTDEDIEGIQALVDKKYATWEWNFGKAPKYSYSNRLKTNFGLIETGINVKSGIIAEIKFFGDYFSLQSLEPIEKLCIGCQHRRDALEKVLSNVDFETFIHGITIEDLLDLCCDF